MTLAELMMVGPEKLMVGKVLIAPGLAMLLNTCSKYSLKSHVVARNLYLPCRIIWTMCFCISPNGVLSQMVAIIKE